MTDHIIKAAREAEAYATSQTADIVDWKAIAQERFYAIAYQQGMERAAEICNAEQKRNEDDGAWLWEAKNCAAAIRAHAQNIDMTAASCLKSKRN